MLRWLNAPLSATSAAFVCRLLKNINKINAEEKNRRRKTEENYKFNLMSYQLILRYASLCCRWQVSWYFGFGWIWVFLWVFPPSPFNFSFTASGIWFWWRVALLKFMRYSKHTLYAKPKPPKRWCTAVVFATCVCESVCVSGVCVLCMKFEAFSWFGLGEYAQVFQARATSKEKKETA